MKKSTERKRIKRMQHDARRLFMHGLISAKVLDNFNTGLSSAQRKL
jgi:hypothetical protein